MLVIYFIKRKKPDKLQLMGTYKIKYFFCLMAIFFIVPFKLLALNQEKDILNQKIADIVCLRKKVTDKTDEAVKIKNQLEEQKKKLVYEIKKQQKETQIESYLQVINSPRIYFNLKLIQQLSQYILQLSKKISDLTNLHEKLTYVYFKINDDLMMIQALNNIKKNKFLSKINAEILNASKEIEKKLLSVENLYFEKKEKIWNEIIKNL